PAERLYPDSGWRHSAGNRGVEVKISTMRQRSVRRRRGCLDEENDLWTRNLGKRNFGAEHLGCADTGLVVSRLTHLVSSVLWSDNSGRQVGTSASFVVEAWFRVHRWALCSMAAVAVAVFCPDQPPRLGVNT